MSKTKAGGARPARFRPHGPVSGAQPNTPVSRQERTCEMIEHFREYRDRVHRALQLRARSDYLNSAMGNPENIRQGVDRLLGYVGFRAGAPPPRCEDVIVTDSGPVFSLGYAGETPFFEVSGDEPPTNAMRRLSLLAKMLPTRIFGMEEAIRWVELTRFPPYDALAERATAALGDPTGCEAMAKIILRLIEERVPVGDVATILQAVSDGAGGSSETELWQVTEDVRVAIRETSAQYYLDNYGVAEAFRDGAELTSELSAGAGVEAARDAICRATKGTETAFLLLADGPNRRRLWEVVESLYLEDRLNRPGVVVKPAEVPAQASLPEATREIHFVAALGL